MNKVIDTSIFLLDDKAILLKIFYSHLCEMGFTNIETYTNPFEMIRKIECGRIPSVVITDYWMPAITGLEVLERVTKNNPHIIGILLTAEPYEIKPFVPEKYTIFAKDGNVFEALGAFLQNIS